MDEKLVFMARRSFLFLNDKTWVKKEESTFDVTMGAFDGAEVAEFIGLFILSKLAKIMKITDFALYRDDGIFAIRGTKRSADTIRKKLIEIFHDVELEIDVPLAPTKSIDFLDVNFELSTGFYSPYRKPLNKPLFIHSDSNHPKTIKD